MSKQGDRALELFKGGYNCAQAIAGAFYKELGLSFEQAIKLSAGFGGGFGRMREVCGAFSGATMVLSSIYTNLSDDTTASKTAIYKIVQDYAEKFKKEMNGTFICRELLNLQKGENNSNVASERTESYYKKRPCGEIIKIAADLVAEMINI